MLTEAERLSDLHLKIKANLCTDVTLQIKEWQKDNYHKVSEERCVKRRKHLNTCLLVHFLLPRRCTTVDDAN